jgi:hypothetical protein
MPIFDIKVPKTTASFLEHLKLTLNGIIIWEKKILGCDMDNFKVKYNLGSILFLVKIPS